MDKSKMLRLDFPAVHPDTAVELMVHHLQLAHALFQIAPDDARDEVVRLFNEQYQDVKWVDDGGLGRVQLEPYYPDAPEIQGGLAFYDKLVEAYEELKQEQGE